MYWLDEVTTNRCDIWEFLNMLHCNRAFPNYFVDFLLYFSIAIGVLY